jgi:hypothetical protein
MVKAPVWKGESYGVGWCEPLSDMVRAGVWDGERSGVFNGRLTYGMARA